jgi:hypothetical protein
VAVTSFSKESLKNFGFLLDPFPKKVFLIPEKVFVVPGKRSALILGKVFYFLEKGLHWLPE